MSLCECGCGEETARAKRTYGYRGVKGQPLRFVNGHNSRLRLGAMHPQWKGEQAGYMATHNWVRRHKIKACVCDECGGEERTDWANISGEYLRDLDDYRELCRGCHVAQDRERDGSPTIGAQLKLALS